MPSIVKRALRKILTPLLWDYTSAEYQCGRLSFSQFGEDTVCSLFFNEEYKGFYVDVGAYHPMLLSNTYDFYRRGWRGLCVDANPEIACLFSRFRPADTFLQTAVGEGSGNVELAMFDVAVFNCLSEHLNEVPEDVRRTARLVNVPIRPLAAILEERNVRELDFLNVDCEGNDLNVLRSNDWTRWKPKVICVEDHAENWQHSEIVGFLASVGYVLRHRVALSSIFIPDDIARAHAAKMPDFRAHISPDWNLNG